MDSVVHFEIPAEDTRRAMKFYKNIFGWDMDEMPEMKYTIVRTTEINQKNRMPLKPGAINGGMMERSDKIKGPVITISVEKIDDAIKKVKENGGKVIIEKMPVADMGFSAYIKDTEGNVIGLWQNAKETASMEM